MQNILGVALIAVGMISLVAHIVETGRRAAEVRVAAPPPAPARSAQRPRGRRARQRRRTGSLPRV